MECAKYITEKTLLFIFAENKNNIKNKMNKKQYISFDMFDTLICRAVPCPEDIFFLVSNKYTENTGNKIYDFKQKRMEAEKKARSCVKKKNNWEDVKLEEIYDCFSELDEEQQKELIKIEQEIEYDLCKPKINGKELFDYAKELNKTIYIISDMYLTKDILKKMLKKCGYDGYKEIYVSSEFRQTKRSGHLYKKVCKCEHIKSQEIFHIGDNPISDGLIAKKNNISFAIIK